MDHTAEIHLYTYQWLSNHQLLSLKIEGQPGVALTMILSVSQQEIIIDPPISYVYRPELDAKIALTAANQDIAVHGYFVKASHRGWHIVLGESQAITQRRQSPRISLPVSKSPVLAIRLDNDQIMSCRLNDISLNGIAGTITGDRLDLVHPGQRYNRGHVQINDRIGIKVGIHIIRAKIKKRPVRTQICAELFGLSTDDRALLMDYLDERSDQAVAINADATPSWAQLSRPTASTTIPPTLPSM